MLIRSLLSTFAFTALALGCTANEPGPNSPGEGTQQGSGEIAQPGTSARGCTSGATSNAEGGFCLALPQGSSTTPTQKTAGQFEYTTAAGAVLVTVRNGDQAAFDAAKSQLVARTLSFGGSSRATDTQFSSTWREGTTPRSTVTMLFEGGKIYECSVSSASAPTLTVCQTLRAL